MAGRISDETIEYVGILAQLELTGQEKEQAREDMGKLLDYIDKLGELDTEGVEPMSHIFPVKNVSGRIRLPTGIRETRCFKMPRSRKTERLRFPERWNDRFGTERMCHHAD